jgi:hypothetical protein
MGSLVIELAKGKHKEPDGDEGEAEDSGTASEAFDAAAAAAFQAVKDDDKEAFRSAFRDAIDACMMGDE